MNLFESLVAAIALFNVALASTDYSSASACVMSVETVTFTSVEFVSTSMCETSTTVVTPTVTVTLLPPGGTEGASTVVSSAVAPTDVASTSMYTVPSLSSVSSGSTSDLGYFTILPIGLPTPVKSPMPKTSATHGSWSISTPHFNHTTAYGTANSTDFPSTLASPTMSVPYPLNSTTAAPATGTDVASISESASASYSTPPEFTAAAGAVNMATAVLFGGVAMAFFGV